MSPGISFWLSGFSYCPQPPSCSCAHFPCPVSPVPASAENRRHLSRLHVKIICKPLQSYSSAYLRLNFLSISAHTPALNILLLEEALCLYFMPEELAALFLEVRMTSPSHLSVLFVAPEHGRDVFSKLVRYKESWNKWVYHIASSKATRGERQELEKVEQNCLVSIYHLWRIEKRWLQKRKLKLDLFFLFPPTANIFSS